MVGETENGALTMMLANFHDRSQTVEVEGVNQEWQQYGLDEKSYYELPEKVEDWESMAGENVELPITMKPFSICLLTNRSYIKSS